MPGPLEDSTNEAKIPAFKLESSSLATSPVMQSQLESTPLSGVLCDAGSSVESGSLPANASWKGWAELENDPRIFTTLLREWGVLNVQVNEVVALDAIFEYPPDTVYGLIFLSRWTFIERGDGESSASTDIWFANQISTFSCATVSLINIINNRKDLNLGDKLNEFHEQTKNLNPKDRGIALDSFDHVRDVHNSFATDTDKMYVDLRLKQDATAAAKKKASKAKNSRKRPRRNRLEPEDDEETGLHFTAYVPAGGHVWCMDGMEATPRDLGPLMSGDNWLASAIPDLQARLESVTANQLEFSLLSLTASNDTASLARDIDEMQRAREDWSPFIAHMVRLHAAKGDLKTRLG